MAYLTLRLREGDGPLRKAVAWVGGLALLPATLFVAGATFRHGGSHPG